MLVPEDMRHPTRRSQQGRLSGHDPDPGSVTSSGLNRRSVGPHMKQQNTHNVELNSCQGSLGVSVGKGSQCASLVTWVLFPEPQAEAENRFLRVVLWPTPWHVSCPPFHHVITRARAHEWTHTELSVTGVSSRCDREAKHWALLFLTLSLTTANGCYDLWSACLWNAKNFQIFVKKCPTIPPSTYWRIAFIDQMFLWVPPKTPSTDQVLTRSSQAAITQHIPSPLWWPPGPSLPLHSQLAYPQDLTLPQCCVLIQSDRFLLELERREVPDAPP